MGFKNKHIHKHNQHTSGPQQL